VYENIANKSNDIIIYILP